MELFPKGILKRKNDEHITFTALADKSEKNIDLWTDIQSPKEFKSIPFTLKEEKEQHNIYELTLQLKHTGRLSATARTAKESAYLTSETTTIIVDPAWSKQAIVYNAFIRFFGAQDLNNDGVIGPGEGGTFDDLKAELDTLQKMGINTLYLNPIHPIGQLYRNYNPHDVLPHYLQPGGPYSIQDHKALDPELAYDKDNEDGDPKYNDPLTEFRELITAAKQRGMRIIMDLVFNHTAHDCVFQRLHPEWYLYKEDITSTDAPYIYYKDLEKGKPWGKAENTMCPNDKGVWWKDVAQLNWEYKLPVGVNSPPKNPTLGLMWDYFKSIPKYWVKNFGIDGFRCDNVYRIPQQFWKECIEETREMAKRNGHDVIFIAESFIDEMVELSESGFIASYGEFHHRISSPLVLKGYLDYIYNVDGEYFPNGTDWFHFPENHDVERSPVKFTSNFVPDEHSGALAKKVNKSRWVLTATLPGIPMIFNGFEKLEWKAINLFGYSGIDWDSKDDIREYIGRVNNARHQHKALQEGEYVYLETKEGLEHTSIMSYARKTDQELLLIMVNMNIHQETQSTILLHEVGLTGAYTLEDLLTGKKYERIGPELFIKLEAGDSHMFLVHFQ